MLQGREIKKVRRVVGKRHHINYSLFHGFWQSFVTIGSCNHLMRIILTYVGNTEKSEMTNIQSGP